MKHLLALLLLLGVPFVALGNAKALSNAVLESERVQASITDDTAKVTGTYHFRRVTRLTKDAKEPEGIYFPIVVPKGAIGTAEDFKLTLRLNGLMATNYSVVTNAPVKVPESDAYSLVWILASFPGSRPFNLNVSVQYEQKLLDGKFYYLPILERARPKVDGYEIRVNADRPVRSLGTSAGGVMVKGPRELVFTPVHLGMIIVVADLQKTAQP